MSDFISVAKNDAADYLVYYLAGACDSRRLWLVFLLLLPGSLAVFLDVLFIILYRDPDTISSDLLSAFIPTLLLVHGFVLVYLLCYWQETLIFVGFVILLPTWILLQSCEALVYLYRILSVVVTRAFDITLRWALHPFWLLSQSWVIRIPQYREKLETECVPGCMSHRSNLCEVCEKLIDSSPLLTGTKTTFTRPVEIHFHHTERQLEVSANTCHLCNLLLQSVRVKANDGFAHSPTTEYGSFEAVPQDWIKIKVWELVSRYLVHSNQIQLCGPGIVSSMPLKIERVADSSEKCVSIYDTGSQSSSALAVSWIKMCREEHETCGSLTSKFSPMRPPTSKFRPTRLLRIRKNKLRLIETTEIPDSVDLTYIALSHCWGGSIDFKLKKTNREAMMQDIEVSFLERNFQDAVTITRRLKHNYLWIDSLCIIQDSVTDWEYESSRMGLLYANAMCTISATASENSRGGCILPKQLFLNDCILRRQRSHRLVVRSWAAMDSSLDYLFAHKVDSAALSKRAWTFQERILSRSVLNFCDGILLFECNTMRASEFHPNGVRHLVKETVQRDGNRNPGPRKVIRPAHEEGTKYITKTKKFRRTGRPGFRRGYHGSESYTVRNPVYYYAPEQIIVVKNDSAFLGIRGAYDMLSHVSGPVDEAFQHLEIHRRWYELVGIYSSRQLTMKNDKMMAISGLGDAIQRKSSLTFVAGMWQQTMPYNVLWIAREPVARAARREAPTWSWASIDGAVDEIIYEASREQQDTLNLVLDVKDVQPIVKHNSVIHHAHLEASAYVLNLDKEKIDFFPDSSSDDPSESENAYIPIVSFKNRVGELEVHGIVVREDALQTATFERMGYFWTRDVSATAEILREVIKNDLKKDLKLI